MVNWNSRDISIKKKKIKDNYVLYPSLNYWQRCLCTLFPLDNVISSLCVKGLYLEDK